MSKPEITIRKLMVAVAIAAVALSLAAHVRTLVRAEDDFAMAILFAEGVGLSILLGIGLAIGQVIRIARRDDAYAARLRRDDVPARCPFTPAGSRSPDGACDGEPFPDPGPDPAETAWVQSPAGGGLR